MVDYLGIKRRMNAALKQYGGGGQEGNDGGDDDPTNDISEFVKIVKDSLESLDIIMHGFDASGFYTGTPLQQVQTLNRGANFVLEHEERKNLFMGYAKRMRQAFNMCSSSDDFTPAQREQVVFYTAVRAVVAKMTKGDAPDVDEMNKRVRQLMQEALQSSGVEEVVKIVEDAHGDLDLFDPKHL